MSKTLLYRLFRIGRLPRVERDRLASEGPACIVEGIPLTIGWRNFRQGGRHIARHRQSFTGAVALTEKRLRVYSFSKPVLDVALEDPAAAYLSVSCPNRGTLSLDLEAEHFHPGTSGRITYWLLTPQAEALADLWSQRRPSGIVENPGRTESQPP